MVYLNRQLQLQRKWNQILGLVEIEIGLNCFFFSTVFLLSKIDPLKVPAVISYLETLSDL